jgi:hypothetical protein
MAPELFQPPLIRPALAVRYAFPAMRRLACALLVILWLAVCSCVPSVDIPDPPDMEPVLSAYANPTANVWAELMDEWDDTILETKQVVEETSILDELLVPIEQLQAKIDSDEEGVIVIGDTEVSQPNGVIRLSHVCAGWDDAEARDPEVNGTIDLALTLEGSRLQPVVWGIFDQCRWKRERVVSKRFGKRLEEIDVEYDGEIRAHFGEPFLTDTRIRQRPITFSMIGNATLDGRSIPIDQSVRVTLVSVRDILSARLDILIQTREGEHFVFFFRDRDIAAGVHDVTGRFSCSLEDRRCESPLGSFSW